MNFQLPYFDHLLNEIAEGNENVIEALGTHVHWGYWEHPPLSDPTVKDFASAARALSELMIREAEVSDGTKVLDVGCGFGGTTHLMNQKFQKMNLIGVNIDPRQLDRARTLVKPKASNKIQFVEENACDLPFEDGSIDTILAVECIFHFPSRAKFFQEAHRILKPGGKLVISDFVPFGPTLPFLGMMFLGRMNKITQFYGKPGPPMTEWLYRKLGRKTGFIDCNVIDITKNTIPTYRVLERLSPHFGQYKDSARSIHEGLEKAARLGMHRYLVISYRR